MTRVIHYVDVFVNTEPSSVSFAGGEAETWAIDLRFWEANSDVAVWEEAQHPQVRHTAIPPAESCITP